jgi:hypothetical protein
MTYDSNPLTDLKVTPLPIWERGWGEGQCYSTIHNPIPTMHANAHGVSTFHETYIS